MQIVNSFDIEASDDAELIYQGECEIGTYAQTNAGAQHFTLKNFSNDDQFVHVLHNVQPNTPVIMTGGVGSDCYFSGWNLMLKKAADGARTGRHMKFEFPELDDDAYEIIKDVQSNETPLSVWIFKGDISVTKKEPKGEHGQYARRVMASKLLMMPDFWQCVGTEQDYEGWLRTQRCALTGGFHKDPDTGVERCEVAHVREINWGSGVSRKPPYFAIPLHHKVHKAQHDKGIAWVWRHANYGGRYLAPEVKYPIPDELYVVKAWFRHLAERYIRLWIKGKIKADLNIPSLTYMSENMFKNYLTSIGCLDMIRFV